MSDTYTAESVKLAKMNAGNRKRRESEIYRIIKEYKEGRGATACMDDIKRVFEGKHR